MKKTTLFLMFLLLGSSISSQVAFYLRPTVNMKTNQGNIFGNRLTKPVYSTMTNQYFSIHTGKMYFDKIQIDLGIYLGLTYKNKHFFEVGIATDHSGIQTQASKHDWGVDHYVADLPIVRKGGINNQSTIGSPFTRLSISYNNLLWKNKTNTLQVRGILGIGSMYNHYVNRKEGIYVTGEIPSFPLGELDSNVFNTEYIKTTTSAWRNSLFLNVGLGLDFYTKKNKYLFSFDLFYVQGTRNVQVDHHRIKVEDYNLNKETTFRYTFSSRGSGFYFMLSRRLQVYPWRPSKNSKGLE
jgi:hypothetical protein